MFNILFIDYYLMPNFGNYLELGEFVLDFIGVTCIDWSIFVILLN